MKLLSASPCDALAKWNGLTRRILWQQAGAMLALAAIAPLAGCGTQGDNLPPVPAAEIDTYKLGPGDTVRILTFGEQDLSGEFRVNDSGRIAVPLLDSVPASGKTADELASQITSALKSKDLYKNPKVTVEVTAYRPFFVLGEVNKPGQYPYQPGMTVVTAAAVAGGFTYRAVTGQFSIVRTTDGKAMEGKAERQTFLQPGDVMTVFERFF